ncbi:carbohydrate ABC transporter permease [Nonomuraea jiangxiensis]|uniref:Multiple sugar transport system permease protein n=1 Tax=Nonomuraea jiangxiensis TaxID=633440 RepID=A0A1G8DL27_9ACTN|nr:sugar ABC transporter permease [Nonomuraea jiangxiensis]SDH58413.1 multiple sugar transport system permease protein [Nonomuraea jiangxiensis]
MAVSKSTAHAGRTGALFVAPAGLLTLVLFVIPLGILVWMSLQDYPLLGKPTFTGFDNYLDIPGNEVFIQAIGFTLAYTVVTTVVMFLISFVLVAIANSRRRATKFYRTSYFLPYVVGTAAATLLWFVDSDPVIGVFNQVLVGLHLVDKPIAFLASPTLAFWSIIVLVSWKFMGFQVIVLLMGLQSIPTALFEAARVDGASRWQQLRFITIPSLRPTLALLFILSVTGSLLAFDQFLILTKGGPDNSTVSVVFAVYNTAFVNFDMGKAAALSVVLLVVLLLISAIQLPLLRRKDV